MAHRFTRGIWRQVVFLTGAGLCIAAPQQAPASGNLADASLEELMNIQVTSVAKKPQRLASTAASVYVISSEDIRRSGITVLPELLRLAPGVQVGRLASGDWAIGIRGFNDEFSNKLLVLVDGRSVFSEFYAGVFWDTLNLSVDDLERIEVIRGPGAAMWGTNAVNGVINIITKSSKATQGVRLTGAAGSASTTDASIQYGGEAGSATYRVGAQNTTIGAFPIVGQPTPSHGWANRTADFRLDWDFTSHDSLFVSGSMYRSVFGDDISAATIAAPSAPPTDARTSSSAGNVAARWQHIVSDTSSFEVRFSFERTFRNDPQTSALIHTFDYGFQHHIAIGSRNDLIWGLTYRDNSFASTPSAALRLNPLNANRDAVSAFAEDELTLVPDRLSFVAGMQISRAAAYGNALQPTARLVWTPRANLSSWVAVSRAVRTTSLEELGIDYYEAPSQIAPSLLAIIHYMGDPQARSETVVAYEAGQRVQVSKNLSFDLSTFYNIYRHLDSASFGTPSLQSSSGIPYISLPVVIGNGRHGESYGSELVANYNVNPRWRLTTGYTWLRVETRAYGTDVNLDQYRTSSATPHHQWQARSYFNLTRTVDLDVAFYYTSAMLQTGIPQHLRGDLRIGWRPSRMVELSAGVQDAFEARHLEYETTRLNQFSEIPRNVYGKATWRF